METVEMKAYLKWYYGYQNFGDELLFLGLLNYLEKHYDIESLIVETQDTTRLKSRTDKNRKFLWSIYPKIRYHQIPHSLFSKVKNIFRDKYSKYHKFLWGGEVLNPERRFPHDGRNLYLWQHFWTKSHTNNYTLLGWIGAIQKRLDVKLYHKLLPHASQIILRDPYSYHIVKNFLSQNKYPIDDKSVVLYEDFSTSILQESKKLFQKHSHPKSQSAPYILINLNTQSFTSQYIDKIKTYRQEYPDCQAIFFPCDMHDDALLFEQIKQHIPKIKYYDWTKHSLADTLSLFYYATAGIGARLHFLYPLKYFDKVFEAIPYKDKVKKLITQDI